MEGFLYLQRQDVQQRDTLNDASITHIGGNRCVMNLNIYFNFAPGSHYTAQYMYNTAGMSGIAKYQRPSITLFANPMLSKSRRKVSSSPCYFYEPYDGVQAIRFECIAKLRALQHP